MAQDIPESKPVVQLPVATHSSIYSHNLTKKDYWINCQAGGLGFYTLLGRNPITLISVGSTSQKIMPAFQIDIGHDYECWLNMLLSMCWDSKFHGFRIDTYFATMGASNCINVEGHLPKDRGRMVKWLDEVIGAVDEKELRRYRENLRHL